jgi:hypothetical protein
VVNAGLDLHSVAGLCLVHGGLNRFQRFSLCAGIGVVGGGVLLVDKVVATRRRHGRQGEAEQTHTGKHAKVN